MPVTVAPSRVTGAKEEAPVEEPFTFTDPAYCESMRKGEVDTTGAPLPNKDSFDSVNIYDDVNLSTSNDIAGDEKLDEAANEDAKDGSEEEPANGDAHAAIDDGIEVNGTAPTERSRLAKIRRVGVAVGGGAMVSVGAVLMVTPLHPIGHAMAIGGACVLGTEFERPRRAVQSAKQGLQNLRNRRGNPNDKDGEGGEKEEAEAESEIDSEAGDNAGHNDEPPTNEEGIAMAVDDSVPKRDSKIQVAKQRFQNFMRRRRSARNGPSTEGVAEDQGSGQRELVVNEKYINLADDDSKGKLESKLEQDSDSEEHKEPC